MQHNNIDIKQLISHVFVGWLVVSQMTLFHIQIATLQGQNTSFTLGLLGGMAGCYLGFFAYKKRWFLKDD